MKLSIIIPTYNEQDQIAAALDAVKQLEGNLEVLVVDGGSSDATVELVRSAGAPLLVASRGRARQMNTGASAATGDVLLFLHADTRLPSNSYLAILQALSNPQVSGGCFRLQFNNGHPLLRACSLLTSLSLPILHYGDSAYFIRKGIFEQLGGYPDLPFMEDIAFWRRFTGKHKHVVLPEAVITSARKFECDGFIRRQLTNMALVSLFLAGVHPSRLVRFYRARSGRTDAMPARFVRRTAYVFRTLWHWLYSNIHLIGQTYYVLEFMRWHKLNARELSPDHPWVSGAIPGSTGSIWEKNIVFRSPRKNLWRSTPDPDEQIARRIGQFLSVMVKHSVVPEPELPQGSKRRMPHGVNYIHGSIHYNGGLLIFNDFQDAMRHISDAAFVKEMKRFAREERRELTIVMRERDYDPEEYAWFVAFVRAHIPWFANGNGPTRKRVLFGTPSPYAAVNPINGSWVRDLKLLHARKHAEIVRPPIERRYFTGTYNGSQTEFTFMERFHAWAQHVQITLKGFQGGLVFTSRKRIEPENHALYKRTSGAWRASYAVSHPFLTIESARAKRRSSESEDMRALTPSP